MEFLIAILVSYGLCSIASTFMVYYHFKTLYSVTIRLKKDLVIFFASGVIAFSAGLYIDVKYQPHTTKIENQYSGEYLK